MKNLNIEKCRKIGLKIYYAVFLLTFLAPNFILADSGYSDSGGFKNPIGISNFEGLIAKIVDVIVQIGVVVVVLMIIYSGFLFVKAQGSEDKLTKAKDTLFWAVIGGVVLLGAQALGDVVCNTAQEFDPNIKC